MTPHAQDPRTLPLDGQESNSQESNNPRPTDPQVAAASAQKTATIRPALLVRNGLALTGRQETAKGHELSRNGLSDFAPADPHEVRARLTRRGSLNGLELDGGTGVVFIPQHALPDLRRRLLLAQERFTAMSGPVPGKRRKRRPASAR